ncbi:MAG: T9SS type A sorting domain-containing protein, partial [Bacteroidota bacterium]
LPLLSLFFSLALATSTFAQLNPDPPIIDTNQILAIKCGAQINVAVKLPFMCISASSKAEAYDKYQTIITRRNVVQGLPACDFSMCDTCSICLRYFIQWNGPKPLIFFNPATNKWCIAPTGLQFFRIGCSECIFDDPWCNMPVTTKPTESTPQNEVTHIDADPIIPSDEVSPLQALHIFPSPVKDKLQLKAYLLTDISQMRIVLYDLNGRIHLDRQVGKAEKGHFQQGLDLGDLPSGYYLLATYDGANVLASQRVLVVD